MFDTNPAEDCGFIPWLTTFPCGTGTKGAPNIQTMFDIQCYRVSDNKRELIKERASKTN